MFVIDTTTSSFQYLSQLMLDPITVAYSRPTMSMLYQNTENIESLKRQYSTRHRINEYKTYSNSYGEPDYKWKKLINEFDKYLEAPSDADTTLFVKKEMTAAVKLLTGRWMAKTEDQDLQDLFKESQTPFLPLISFKLGFEKQTSTDIVLSEWVAPTNITKDLFHDIEFLHPVSGNSNSWGLQAGITSKLNYKSRDQITWDEYQLIYALIVNRLNRSGVNTSKMAPLPNPDIMELFPKALEKVSTDFI
jgi:hypothetical protein